jgi:diaminohydroxyphosphoribosylaminopyrimidine deaminase/5-amino-6-(5-phosphoribosylamino)uracil reductase
VATETEIAAMGRAVTLAASVGEATRPNPNVGAVVLDAAGVVVGEGRHERAGGPHAEVVALRSAGDRARGGTMVVTLEPCAHTGRTGPCTEALLAAGVGRVVYATADETAQGGGGAARLRAEGVDVEGGVLTTEAEQANERWLTAVRLQRPFVVWKVAATLDGRVAAADGTSRWISSVESRRDAHRLRAECDTIVAGVGTVLADDPHLTVRDEQGRVSREQPLRVVVDTHGRTPGTARVRDAAAPTWVATAAELGQGPLGGVDLEALVKALWARDRTLVLLEGGPTLAGGFLRAGLVDRVVAYVAPVLLGAGVPVLAGTGIGTLADGFDLEFLDVRQVGPDVRLTARPRREG